MNTKRKSNKQKEKNPSAASQWLGPDTSTTGLGSGQQAPVSDRPPLVGGPVDPQPQSILNPSL